MNTKDTEKSLLVKKLTFGMHETFIDEIHILLQLHSIKSKRTRAIIIFMLVKVMDQRLQLQSYRSKVTEG